VLGPLDATCIVIGAVIGVGIFFTPSRVAQLAGSGRLALLAWAIGGGIALLGALTYAELGGMYPRSGAQYEALRDAYGPFPAFLFVFCNSTAIQAGSTAIIALICTENLGVALRGGVPQRPLLTVISAILIVGLMTANVVGVRWGSAVQNITVFAKVATLLLVTVLAAFAQPIGPNAPAVPAAGPLAGWSVMGALCAALVPMLFSFGGWQHALWIAGEIRRPQRNIPLAIIGGMLVVVVVYLLINWAYLRLLGYEGVAASQTLAADAVAAVWPGAGGRIIAAAVTLSALGVLNAQLLSGPRLVFGMAADGRFFGIFGQVNGRFGTPAPAILLIGGMALVLLFAAGRNAVDKLLNGVVSVDSIFFVLTGFAVLVLRWRQPTTMRSVRVPGYPVVPLLFVLGEIGIIMGSYWDPAVRAAAIIGVGWIIVATACYLLLFRAPKRA
jgi:APA family basic amino acid/polyamine antiporter